MTREAALRVWEERETVAREMSGAGDLREAADILGYEPEFVDELLRQARLTQT